MCLDIHQKSSKEKHEQLIKVKLTDMIEHKQTYFSVLWMKVLAIELKDVPGGQASSSEATSDFARCDDVRSSRHHICCPPSARIYWAP